MDKEIVKADTGSNLPAKKEIANLGSLFLERRMLKMLINWVNRNISNKWNVPPKDVLMHFKLMESGNPSVRVSDVQGKHSTVLTNRLGRLEDIALLCFEKVLIINKRMAEEWKIEKHQVIMVLQLVEGKPRITIINVITEDFRIV